MSFERQGAPRIGRSGRSPALERRGREVRGRSDAGVTAAGLYEAGDGLRIVDGLIAVQPARDPGALAVRARATDTERIAALETYINQLRAELVAARFLGR